MKDSNFHVFWTNASKAFGSDIPPILHFMVAWMGIEPIISPIHGGIINFLMQETSFNMLYTISI